MNYRDKAQRYAQMQQRLQNDTQLSNVSSQRWGRSRCQVLRSLGDPYTEGGKSKLVKDLLWLTRPAKGGANSRNKRATEVATLSIAMGTLSRSNRVVVTMGFNQLVTH